MTKQFNIHREYGSELKTGESIKVESMIPPNEELLQTEINEHLLENITQEARDRKEKHLQKMEQEIYNELLAKVEEWKEVAKQLSIIKLAKDYEAKCEFMEKKQTTGNQWVTSEYGAESISNNVYNMYARVYEDTKWDKEQGKSVPVAWYVTYHVSYNATNMDTGYSITIADINRKRYTDKDKAYKYIEGRKKAYIHLFQEMHPEIPKEAERLFQHNGKLLKGYRVAQEGK